VFVFPSKTDTFGLVLLEAMACGLPVAAYPVTGPIDVVGMPQTSQAPQGGVLDHDLKVACEAALTLPRNKVRAYAETFSWDTATSLFESHLVASRGDTTYNIIDNPHKGNKGVSRAMRAAKNSVAGLLFAINEESAFRQELILALILVPVAVYLPVTYIEKTVMIASVVLVLIVELLNSSVEAAIDRISFDHHGLSKRAKDYGSAAVFLALALCGGIYAVILASYLWPV
jgi:diacylglycerol kinase (ATP)